MKTCLLMILDGFGISKEKQGNAVLLAKTPNIDSLFKEYPHTELFASEEFVGLPKGIMGNSEVGHLNIGAGRVVYQELLKINNAIKTGSFFQKQPLNNLIDKSKNAIHLLGLLSDGGVHSDINHLFAILKILKEKQKKKVYIHIVLDGRDTPPKSGANYVKQLEEFIAENQIGKIASICGRFYAMDRDKRWERVSEAYNLIALGIGIKESIPYDAVLNAYDKGETDEFVKPISFENIKIQKDDSLIFFNFRADRAREISTALTKENFDKIQGDIKIKEENFLTMTSYDEKFNFNVIFETERLKKVLGEVISENGLNQIRIAETEKYAHVTYFFNGGEEKPFLNEDRVLIPSPKEVLTYDLKPEMSAMQVMETLLSKTKEKKYHLIVLNFANPDMVGHTGNLEAAIKAIETIDFCIGKILKELKDKMTILITSDHGNAEKMIDGKHKPHTAHTLNKVPFILVSNLYKNAKLKENGALENIAPTILDILKLEKPKEMTGDSLIEN